jgi:hypothetical protein
MFGGILRTSVGLPAMNQNSLGSRKKNLAGIAVGLDRAFAQQLRMAIEQRDVAGMDSTYRFAKPFVADHRPVEQLGDALAVAGRALARVVERGLAAPVGLPTERAVPDEQFDHRERPAASSRMQRRRAGFAVLARRGASLQQHPRNRDALLR